MLAGEQENGHESDEKEPIEVKDPRKQTNHDISQDGVEHKNDIPTVEQVESKEPSTNDEFLETKMHESSGDIHGNESRTGTGEHARSENGESLENEVTVTKENERAGNTRNRDEDKIENAQCDEKRNKGNWTPQKEGSKVKGDPFEEIYHDDENNGFNQDESEGRKEGLRKTRFSSEVRIEPRAYFQTGNDAVVTLVECYLPCDC